MSYAGPQTSVVFVIGYGHKPLRPKYPQKPRRETWRPQRNIPQPPVDRDLDERMREIAHKTIADVKPQIEAMLKAA
jgi:hypothetical protein